MMVRVETILEALDLFWIDCKVVKTEPDGKTKQSGKNLTLEMMQSHQQ